MFPEQYSIARAELLWRLLPMAAACGLLAAAALATGQLLVVRARRLSLRLGNRGTTELEFALALPIFLVSVLTTVQVALMVNANLIVDYAAFCAARSAAVWVPQNLPSEPAYEVSSDVFRDSEKLDRVHRAAVMSVIPISPRLSRFRFGINIPKERPPFDPAAVARLAENADATIKRPYTLAQLGVAAADKWAYAYFLTKVDLLDEEGREDTRFDGTVTARVTHPFELAVPFAGQIFGAMFGDRYIPFIGGYYMPIAASYTLQMGAS